MWSLSILKSFTNSNRYQFIGKEDNGMSSFMNNVIIIFKKSNVAPVEHFGLHIMQRVERVSNKNFDESCDRESKKNE